MTQGRTLVVALVALLVGFGAGFVLRPTISPVAQTMIATGPIVPSGARGTQYFLVHLDEAREIVAQCRDGAVRGDECANADAAIIKADARERSRKFLGERP